MNAKSALVAAWLLAAVVGGSFGAADRPSYWSGAGILLLALAVPALAQRAAALFSHLATKLRKGGEDEDA